MQRAKVLQVFEQDLKESISGLKKDEYRRAMRDAHDQMALNSIEHEININFQLIQDDRIQLLSELNVLPRLRVDQINPTEGMNTIRGE
jgi:hypothetical protein